jgi:integrase
MPGEGSVFQTADGRWVAALSIGGRARRRYIRRIRRTRREALDALEQLKAERRAGVSPTRITTGAYLAQWVRDARNIRPTTRRGYEAVVRYHLAPTLGDVRLVDLTPVDVERALGQLAPHLAPKSLRNVHAVLRRALGQAVRAGLVMRNVAAREFVDAPRVPVEEPRALSADEVRRFVDVVRGDRLEALFITAVGTGLRQGELLGLAWEDVDLDAGHLTVRRELVRRDGQYLRDELKTDRSRRLVPLSPAVAAALRRHREQTIAEGFVPTATGPVFTNRAGGPLNGSWLTHRFYDLLAAAGIPRLPFKNLRTTFSSRLFEAGVPDRRIADLLGHTRTKTTQGHYIGTAGTSQTPAIDAIEALVG